MTPSDQSHHDASPAIAGGVKRSAVLGSVSAALGVIVALLSILEISGLPKNQALMLSIATFAAGCGAVVIAGKRWSRTATVSPSTRRTVLLVTVSGLVGAATTWAILTDVGRVPPRPEPAPFSTLMGPAGSISHPRDEASVAREITATGWQKGLADDHEALLVLRIINVDSNHPTRIEIRSDGSWSGAVTVGGDEGYCAEYVLSLVDLGPKGAQKVDEYLSNSDRSGISTNQWIASYEAVVLDTVRLTRTRKIVPNSFGDSPSSVEKCDGPTGNRDLNQYCRTLGFSEGVHLSRGAEAGAYDNWACKGASARVDFTNACAFAYPVRKVVAAAPNNASDPYTWRCYLDP